MGPAARLMDYMGNASVPLDGKAGNYISIVGIIAGGTARKERIYLDREMPCADGWTPKDFDLDPEELRKYRDIYRFLPAFAEILV